ARHHRRMTEHHDPDLAIEIDEETNGALHARDAPVHPAAPRWDRTVRPRHDPRRRALEQIQPGRPLLHLRHELHGGGAGANHRDPLTAHVERVIPPRGMERAAFESVETRKL